MPYATRAQLVTYGAPPGVTIPADPEATRRLTRASELVDELLIGAVYDVDSNGDPTQATDVATLRDATCAQVVWWLTGGGDETGASAGYRSVAIGSVKLDRGSGGNQGQAERYAPQAITHLKRGRLLPVSPITVG